MKRNDDNADTAVIVKRRADHTARNLGAGYRVVVHYPDLHVAAAFETDGVEAIDLHLEHGRAAFDRMARELVGEPPAWHEHSVAERIRGEHRSV